MITVLQHECYYNVFFNGILVVQDSATRPWAPNVRGTFQISGNSVLFEWPGEVASHPIRRYIIFDNDGRITYDGIPCF